MQTNFLTSVDVKLHPEYKYSIYYMMRCLPVVYTIDYIRGMLIMCHKETKEILNANDLLALMEEEDADAYTSEKEAAAQAEQDRLNAEEEAKKAAEEAAASGTEQPKENKVTKIASGFLGVVVLIALAAGGGFYAFTKQKQKKQAEKEALDPDAGYTEDKGNFEIPTEDEPEDTGEEDTEPI